MYVYLQTDTQRRKASILLVVCRTEEARKQTDKKRPVDGHVGGRQPDRGTAGVVQYKDRKRRRRFC
jgi:hypothetical protein